MELPEHPETDDTGRDQEPSATRSKGAVLIVAVIGVLFALLVILHLIGVVGPGTQ